MGHKDLEEPLLEDLEIESVETRGRVSTFTGNFKLKGRRYGFTGIAVMTVGGPTLGVSLESQDEAELLSSGLTREKLDEVLAEVQRKILEGGFKLGGEVKFSDDQQP